MELIRLDAGLPDHLAPFRGFRRDELAKIRSRAAVHDDADIGQALFDLVVGERLVDLFVERVDDRLPVGAPMPSQPSAS